MLRARSLFSRLTAPIVLVLGLLPVSAGFSPAPVSARPAEGAATATEATTGNPTATVRPVTGYRRQFIQRELASSGAWCWFADPRAIYHHGRYRRTYIGWIERNGDVKVSSYDYDNRRRTTVTIRQHFQVDDHNNPALIVRPDGRLLVFWSGHNGSQMLYRRSAKPEDVTSWLPEQRLGTNTKGSFGNTYPNPVQLRNEKSRLWLFWRGGNMNPAFSIHSQPGGWSQARTLISMPGDRPYMKIASDGLGTIHFAFTQAHPRSVQTSIFYMAYRGGSFYRADGTRIGGLNNLPFRAEQTDVVYDADATGAKAWTHDIAFDQAGRPVITFATFPTNDDHRYHYARWTGDHWLDVELTHAGGTISGNPYEDNYSGGITLDHEQPEIVYLSRPVNGVHEIERWTTADAGLTWSQEAITSGSTEPNYRPVTPRGLPAGWNMEVIWMRGRYPSFTRFETLLRRTSTTTSNAAPSARWSASPTKGRRPMIVRFNAYASSDPGDRLRSLAWRFGDGAKATGRVVNHRFGRTGRYWVQLTVTDSHGAVDTSVGEIVVS